MKKLFNPLSIQVGINLLVLVALTKALSLSLVWFLPSQGKSILEVVEYGHKYQRIDFKNMLETAPNKAQSKVKNVQKVNLNSVEGIGITNMILKGLYGKDEIGYALVSLKKSPKKTVVISVGEVFFTYTLVRILNDSVLFTKDEKQYILSMKENKNKNKNKKPYIKSAQTEEVKPRDVEKKDITYYANNPSNIVRDISIATVRSGNTIKGFKVTRIKAKSKMQNLGLKVGDVIIKANNVKLRSYKDALNLYAKMDTLDTIQIVVLRNYVEKELIYELH